LLQGESFPARINRRSYDAAKMAKLLKVLKVLKVLNF